MKSQNTFDYSGAQLKEQRQKILRTKTKLVHADAKTRCETFGKLTQYDLFAETVGLNYPGGDGEYVTWCGTCATFIIAFVTLAFCAQSMYTLWMYKGTSLTTVILQDAHYLSFEYTESSGLQIAVGFNMDYFDPLDFIDVEVGILGVDGEQVISETLETYPCTKEDIFGSDSKFYPIVPSQKTYLESHLDGLRCFDLSKTALKGNL